MEIERKMLFSFSNLSEREKKNLEIFELIRKKGTISRSDISRTTGINMVSVSNYVKEYLSKRLIIERGLDISSGGRKPELIELNVNGDRVAGIEIGPRQIKLFLTDLAVNVIEKLAAPVEGRDIENLVKRAMDLIKTALKKASTPQGSIAAIGIGVAGDDYLSFGPKIEKEFGIDTFMGHPASCAAFAEKRLNPALEDKDLLYIYSDRGRGVVIGKDAFLGAEYGQDNELERYLQPWGQGLGTLSVARREIARGVGTEIVGCAKGDVDSITIETVLEAARADDRVALDILESAGITLGLRIAYLANLFHPAFVVFGGEDLEKAKDIVSSPIAKMVRRLAFKKVAESIKIIPSDLGEDGVGMGAAALAAREVFLKA